MLQIHYDYQTIKYNSFKGKNDHTQNSSS